MKLDWALTAREAALTTDGTIQIIGGAVDTLIAPKGSFPSYAEIFIAGRVVAPMDEWRQAGHQLEIEIVDSRDERMARYTEPLRESTPPALLREDSQPGRLLALPQRWKVNAAGVFSLHLYLDKEFQRTFRIAVLEGDRRSTTALV
jgi:hypothetical protein